MGNDIQNKFEKMGARVKLLLDPRLAEVRVDVRHDGGGEYFDVRHGAGAQVNVVDVVAKDRHLLLTSRVDDPMANKPVTARFLCGHDERSWFVAAVPESAGANNVRHAKDALKPAEVWQSMREHGTPMSKRDRRKTSAFLRQGEWFFLPRPWLRVEESRVLKREPIRRGSGKPHECERLFRSGGETVYVHRRYPNGLTGAEYAALPEEARKQRGWRTMVRDARVYAKGSIRHPDHKTIRLPYWHQVVMNTETRSRAMRHVAFLD
jgi:hypothetical protein